MAGSRTGAGAARGAASGAAQAAPDPAQGRGHSKRLDREKIVSAALALARAGGAPRLTMRRIAAALGVDVSALYWHFRNKDALLAEVAAAAARRVALDVPADGPWRERCRAVCDALRRGLREHPELGLLSGRSPGLTPFNARATAALAASLEGSGLDARGRVLAAQALLQTATALAGSEALTARTTPDEARAFVRGVAAALPAELAAAWRELARLAPRQSFDATWGFAVEALLDGIERAADAGREEA